MRKLISYYWKLLTDINERGIYRRDEFDINLLKDKENSKYLLISRQSARVTVLTAMAIIISTLALIISTCALIVSINLISKSNQACSRPSYNLPFKNFR